MPPPELLPLPGVTDRPRRCSAAPWTRAAARRMRSSCRGLRQCEWAVGRPRLGGMTRRWRTLPVMAGGATSARRLGARRRCSRRPIPLPTPQAEQAAPRIQAASICEEACAAWSRGWQAGRAPAPHGHAPAPGSRRRRSRPPSCARRRAQGGRGGGVCSSRGSAGTHSRHWRGPLLHR